MSERVNGRVRTSGRTCARTCVRLHVHWPRPRARAKIRSTGVDLISVRAKRYNTKSILKRQGRAKIRSTQSRPYFRTCARVASDRANARTYAHTFARTYAHSYIHTFARTFTRTHGSHTRSYPRSCHSSLHVRYITKIFLRDFKKS